MNYTDILKQDKNLAALLKRDLFVLSSRKNIPVRLMASIMSQQLSTQVAKVIYDRFLALYAAKEPKPQQVLDTSDEILRGIGLSYAKVGYIKNVANFCMEHKITDKKLQTMSNEAIITKLTEIKGVGRWTVEMLLMFSLGREDVFAPDDLGIQQAMCKLYKLSAADKKKMKAKMTRIAAKWAPFQTYACLHLWAWKDQ